MGRRKHPTSWAGPRFPVSGRDCYAGVGENSIYVADGIAGTAWERPSSIPSHRRDQAGLWTLQTSIFPENRASIALHHSAGYRTLGVRERIAQHHGLWRDTVFLERRAAAEPDGLT